MVQEMDKHKVMIVEDHPIALEGLSLAINEQDHLELMEAAGTAREALDVMSEQVPDVAVIDLELPDKGGLDLIEDIKNQHPDVAMLVVSAHSEALYAERALNAGALGYIHKNKAIRHIVEGIEQVLSGEVYVSEETSQRLVRKQIGSNAMNHGAPEESLSDREMEVFEHIGRGYSSREIGEKLDISVKTVESHRARIKKKLDLSNARELLRYAIQWLVGESAV